MPRRRSAAPFVALLVAAAALVAAGPLTRETEQDRASARLLSQVLGLVDERFVDTLSDSALFARAARGVVKELGDPYSELYSPKELEAFQANTEGHYAGLGMLVEDQEGQPTVSRVYPNTPAERGGVIAGDRIVAVNEHVVNGWPLGRVTDSLRGPIGTSVRVTFARTGAPAPINGTFAREKVRIPAVSFATMLPGKVAYVPVHGFNETAAAETRRVTDSLRRAGATSLVLDLRGDGGGIVDGATDIASMFLPKGTIIARVRGRGTDLERYVTEKEPVEPTLPVAVLVNEGSASASEILAGALQDHDRALLVGERTFGKGLVQGLWRLDGGWALKLTTGRWLSPVGRSIHRPRSKADSAAGERLDSTATYRSVAGRALLGGGGGIVPDVTVEPDTLSGAARALSGALAPQTATAYRVMYAYALELKPQVDTNLIVRQEWRDELFRRWREAGVKIERTTFDSAQATVDRMLAGRVGRFTYGDAQVMRRFWREDVQLVSAVEALQAAKSTAELLRLEGEVARDVKGVPVPAVTRPPGS